MSRQQPESNSGSRQLAACVSALTEVSCLQHSVRFVPWKSNSNLLHTMKTQ